MFNISISQELLFAILVIIIVLIIACIIYLVLKEKQEDRVEMDELLDDLAQAKPRDNLINAKIEVAIGEDLPTKVVKENDEKLDLDEVLNKMQENLNKQEDIKEKFETEQEEKSVISYQELMENMKDNDYSQEIEEYEKEQEKSYEEITKEKVKEFLTKEEKKEDKKFQNTDFISPVFGKMDASVAYPTVKSYDQKHKELEELKSFKHANVVSNKNAEFLQNLKDFRNNL